LGGSWVASTQVLEENGGCPYMFSLPFFTNPEGLDTPDGVKPFVSCNWLNATGRSCSGATEAGALCTVSSTAELCNGYFACTFLNPGEVFILYAGVGDTYCFTVLVSGVPASNLAWHTLFR
jgi:hypothetical protein